MDRLNLNEQKTLVACMTPEEIEAGDKLRESISSVMDSIYAVKQLMDDGRMKGLPEKQLNTLKIYVVEMYELASKTLGPTLVTVLASSIHARVSDNLMGYDSYSIVNGELYGFGRPVEEKVQG